jgi:hypothetical protein
VVGMQDGVILGFTSDDGHAEGVGDEFGAHVTVDTAGVRQTGGTSEARVCSIARPSDVTQFAG